MLDVPLLCLGVVLLRLQEGLFRPDPRSVLQRSARMKMEVCCAGRREEMHALAPDELREEIVVWIAMERRECA